MGVRSGDAGGLGVVGGVGLGVGIGAGVTTDAADDDDGGDADAAEVDGVEGFCANDGGGLGGVGRGDRGSLRRLGVRFGDGSVVTTAGRGAGIGDTLFVVRFPANRSRSDLSDAAILEAADDLDRIFSSASIRCSRSTSGAGRSGGDGCTGWCFLEPAKKLHVLK